MARGPISQVMAPYKLLRIIVIQDQEHILIHGVPNTDILVGGVKDVKK